MKSSIVFRRIRKISSVVVLSAFLVTHFAFAAEVVAPNISKGDAGDVNANNTPVINNPPDTSSDSPLVVNPIVDLSASDLSGYVFNVA